MATKKIILFIVEGISDQTSLALILSKLIKNNKIEFQIVYGDITSDDDTTVQNVKTKIDKQVKKFLSRNYYQKRDILKIIHLVDTDGAYVDKSYIKKGEVDKFIYSHDYIEASNIDDVVKRNDKKSRILNILSTCNKISGSIDYTLYYFSCNLEHVLHDECNMDDDLKMIKAYEFTERYKRKVEDFLEFIRDKSFAVDGDHKTTWNFIKIENNSLKRYSNFHLFFDS